MNDSGLDLAIVTQSTIAENLGNLYSIGVEITA